MGSFFVCCLIKYGRKRVKLFAEKCSREAGCPESVAEKVIEIFPKGIAEKLSQGNTVDHGADFGVFSNGCGMRIWRRIPRE